MYCIFVGQGYIWLAHREPGSAAWDLAVQSKQLWEDNFRGLDDSAHERPQNPLEWQVLMIPSSVFQIKCHLHTVKISVS